MNDFNRSTVNTLARKGITIIGLQALPVDGCFLNTVRGYCLNDNGTHEVRTFLEVLSLAK